MRRYAAILSLSTVLCVFLISGCIGDGEELSRYPKVSIPGYEAKDYYSLMFDKNNEIVYNAVCNLISDAAGMGSLLSDKKADKKSEKFILALNTRQRVVELLQSRDDRIVSASLRFLQLFSSKYAEKEDLIDSVLKVRNNSRNVRCERLTALTAMAGKGSPVSDKFLNRSLKDASWLVSRAAYGLINSLENEKFRLMLIERYKKTLIEYEKLLILTSMTDNFSSDVFKFFAQGVFETRNEKIKDLIFRSFKNAADTSEVLRWVDKNYEKLSSEDITAIIGDSDISHDFASSLYLVCIRKGWVPDDEFFGTLYQSLSMLEAGGQDPADMTEDGIKRGMNIRNIEKEILDSKTAGGKWLLFKGEKDAFAKDVCSELMAEYEVMAEQFSQKVDEVLDRHNVPPEKKEDFFKALSSIFINKESFEDAVKFFKAMEPKKKS